MLSLLGIPVDIRLEKLIREKKIFVGMGAQIVDNEDILKKAENYILNDAKNEKKKNPASDQIRYDHFTACKFS